MKMNVVNAELNDRALQIQKDDPKITFGEALSRARARARAQTVKPYPGSIPGTAALAKRASEIADANPSLSFGEALRQARREVQTFSERLSAYFFSETFADDPNPNSFRLVQRAREIHQSNPSNSIGIAAHQALQEACGGQQFNHRETRLIDGLAIGAISPDQFIQKWAESGFGEMHPYLTQFVNLMRQAAA